MTTTEDRIATKMKRLDKECINIYQTANVKPTEEWWGKLDALGQVLHSRLGKRPISLLEIDAAIIDHRNKFLALCTTKQ